MKILNRICITAQSLIEQFDILKESFAIPPESQPRPRLTAQDWFAHFEKLSCPKNSKQLNGYCIRKLTKNFVKNSRRAKKAVKTRKKNINQKGKY